jgi:hypothetical protein
MTQEPQKSNAVLILIAIIGVVGTIVATAIGVIGNYNIEKLRQDAELTRIALVSIATQGGATQMVLQSTVNAPTEPPAPTYTPYPTLIPEVVMTTSESAVPVSINTLPDSILDVGQSWRQDELLLTLNEVNYNPNFPESECDISFSFYIESVASSNIVNVSVSQSQFQAIDNLNRPLQRAGFSQMSVCPAAHIVEPFSGIVEPGKRFPSSGFDFWQVGFTVNLTDTSLDHIIVTVNGLYHFDNAKWKVLISN